MRLKHSTKAERKEYALRRARELAEFGKFTGWLAIEHELRFEEGIYEARQELDNERIRDELDRLCKAAMQKATQSDAERP